MQIYRRAPYIFVAACSILYLLPFLRIFSHDADEGTLILGAVRVSGGQVPFRDFFEVMGPGTFYWLALFFRLLGTTWLTTRVYLLVTTTAVAILLLYLARRLRCGLEVAPVIFFIAVSFHTWTAISHHMDSNLFGLLSFAAFVFWTDKPRPLTLFLAGAAAGLTTWFMLPKGILLFLALVLLLLTAYHAKPVLRLALANLTGGFLLVHAAVFAVFWVKGGLADLVSSNLIWPFTNYSSINVVPYGFGFRQLYWPAFTASFTSTFSAPVGLALSGILSTPFVIVMGLPLVLLALVIHFRRSAFDRLAMPYWVAGAAFWLSEMHRTDLVHIVWGSPLFVLLAFSYCRQIPGIWVKSSVQLVIACSTALALLNPLLALSAQCRHDTRRGVLYDSFPKDAVLDFVNTHVAQNQPVFIYPSPMYYFLAAARNPTRYSILMYRTNTDQQFREVVQSLETSRVRYVVWDHSFTKWASVWFPSYRIPPQDQLIFEPYLMEHYRVVGDTEDACQFLERKEEVTTSSVLAK